MSTRTRIMVVATLLVLASTTPAAGLSLGSDTPAPEIQQYAAGPSYIVHYDDGKLASLGSWANSSTDRKLIRTHNASNTATIAAPAWQVDAGFVDAALAGHPLADQLDDRGYVTSIRPNYILSNAEPVPTLTNESDWQAPTVGYTALNDPEYPTEGVAYDNVSETTLTTAADTTGASNLSATGAGQTVAVIDTGCNVAGGAAGVQGDLKNESASFLGDGKTTVKDSGYDAVLDENGHGSWVTASITGEGAIKGVAPDAQILCLQALGSDGSGSTSDIAAAIRYAADSNASVDVLTMSLGSPVYSKELADAISYAFENSDIKAITVAAGNSRQTTRYVASPADVEGVIGVGATTDEVPAEARSAYFSQVSGQTATDTSLDGDEHVDVAAPGMQLTATVATTAGGTTNETLSGTSMATPLVAASIARALEANSSLADLEHDEFEQAVEDTARPAQHLAVAEAGHGMIAADNLADGTHPETSQKEVRTDAAKSRDIYYQALADSSGGLFADVQAWRNN